MFQKSIFIFLISTLFLFPASALGVDEYWDNGDQTVTHTATGLMWAKSHGTIGSGEDIKDEMTWEEALEQYIADINAASLGGYDDWRLPAIKELLSLAAYNQGSPALRLDYFEELPSGGGGTPPWDFWSSTTSKDDRSQAWGVQFRDGDNGTYDKAASYYVRAVRGGQYYTSGNVIILTPRAGSAWTNLTDDGNFDQVVMPITWDKGTSTAANVQITLSRDGGNTFGVTVADSTANDGSFDWNIQTDDDYYNCMLKIEPVGQSAKTAVQGMFTIIKVTPPYPGVKIVDFPACPTNLDYKSYIEFDVTYENAANQATHYKYKLEGETSYSAEIPLSENIIVNESAEATYTLYLLGGKTGSWQPEDSPTVYSWTVDKTPPGEAAVTGPTLTNSPDATLTIGGTDVAKYIYSLNGEAYSAKPTDCTMSLSLQLTGLDDGINTVDVIGMDQAGNESETVHNYQFTVDTLAPASVISNYPTCSPCTANEASNIGVGGDGVTAYKYSLDGVNYSSETDVGQEIDLTALPNGTNFLYVIGKDAAGNWQPYPTSVNWEVSVTEPTAQFESTPGTPTTSTSADFLVSTSGNTIDAFKYAVDGGAYSAVSYDFSAPSSFTLSGLSEDVHYVDLVGRRKSDGVWQSESNATRFTWSIDKTVPEATIFGGPGSATTATTATFMVGPANEVVLYQYKLDSGTWSGWRNVSTPIELSGLSTATHTLYVTGRDAAGNTQQRDDASDYSWTVSGSLADNIIITKDPDPDPDEKSPFVTWSWHLDGDPSATFRYQITTSATPSLSGDYSDQTQAAKAAESPSDVTWWIHVQAKDSNGFTGQVVSDSKILNQQGPFCNSFSKSFASPGLEILNPKSTGQIQSVSDTITSSLSNAEGSSVTATINIDVNDIHAPPEVPYDFNEEIEIKLYSPDNPSSGVTLLDQGQADGVDFVDTVFSDDGAAKINTGGAPYTGTYKPYSATMAALFGTNKTVAGNWKLQIKDKYRELPPYPGYLESWQLDICYEIAQAPPVAVHDTTSVGIDTSNNEIFVTANDYDPNGDPITIINTTTPSSEGGTVSDDDAKVYYTPKAGFTGPDTFTYTIEAVGGESNEATVTVNVGVVAVEDADYTAYDTPVTIDVLANDSALECDTPTCEIISVTNPSPVHGSVSTNGDTVTYTPNPGGPNPSEHFIGADAFSYTVRDDSSAEHTATVTVTVNNSVVDDGGFEKSTGASSSPDAFWNFSTANPLRNRGDEAHEGDWMAMFTSNATLSQSVSIPASPPSSSPTLHFWIKIPHGSGDGALNVKWGTTTLLSFTSADWAAYDQWTHVEKPLTAGSSDTLSFEFTTSTGNSVFLVDDVSISVSELKAVFTSTPDNPANATSAQFKVTGAGAGGEYRYQVNGGGDNTIAASDPTTISLDAADGVVAGQNTFDIWAKDDTLTEQPAPTTYAWTVDINDPVVVASNVPVYYTTSTSVEISVSGPDIDKYEYKLDGAAWVYNQNPSPATVISKTGLSQGLHTLQVTVYDKAGNTSAETIYWVVDTIAPTVSGLANDATCRVSKTWDWYSTDSSPTTFQFEVDQSSGTTPSGDYTNTSAFTKNEGNGTYYIHVRAMDAAGNVGPIVQVSACIDSRGNVNGDDVVDLKDAIVALKVLTDIYPGNVYVTAADVNADSLIGLEEVIYILQTLAGLRP